MEPPPTGPGRTLIMTRAGAIGIALGLICISFPAGWVLSKFDSRKSAMATIASIEAQHADKVKFLQELPSLPVFTGPDGKWIEDQEQALRDFVPSPGDSVKLSHVGGMDALNRHITISGSGVVTVSDEAGTKEAAQLTEKQRADFFKKVIASGLAAYSEEAVCLKTLLQDSGGSLRACFGPTTRVEILIPRLKVDRRFELYAPEVEAMNYPDIIEYRSAAELEKEILGFVP